MKKIGNYLLYGGGLLFAVALIYVSISLDKKAETKNSTTKQTERQKSEVSKPAEKVQIYAFHSSKRCYSCKTMGQYTRNTLDEKFQSELQNGKIEFREINVDLPENRELAEKFRATGSSLFVNTIIDGEDSIKEETQVWRLLSNKDAFSKYLSGKLRGIIGEEISTKIESGSKKGNVTSCVGEDYSKCNN
jgi:ATP-dependent protease HslVU (ClpYQ) ATPase subunit